jgi:hypothetical protein
MNATMAATQPLLGWIAAHPYQTMFHVVNGVVLLTPAAATVPFFNALGLSAGGPVAGSAATSIMSFFGYVPAGGIYATAQSAAMGGYGASIAAGAAQAGAMMSSGAAWLFGRNGTGV